METKILKYTVLKYFVNNINTFREQKDKKAALNGDTRIFYNIQKFDHIINLPCNAFLVLN